MKKRSFFKATLFLIFFAIGIIGCTMLPQHDRQPAGQGANDAEDTETQFREQRNQFYRQSIPSQFQTRIDFSPAMMAGLKNSDCGEYTQWISQSKDSANRTAFILNKINRPFWFATISNTGGNDYILGNAQDMHELICILKVINGGDLDENHPAPLNSSLVSQILDQPSLNWAFFNIIINDWETNGSTSSLLEKLFNHPNVDIYSVDDATRILFKKDFTPSDRVHILDSFYHSTIYLKNSAFFDFRMNIQIRALPAKGAGPVLEYLASKKATAFGQENLLNLAIKANPDGDLTSVYNALSYGQPQALRSRLLTSILSSDAQISNPDQVVKALWMEYKNSPSENDFFYYLAGYEQALKRLSPNTIYAIYWELLDLLPNSDHLKIAETDLMMDKTHVDLERRVKLFVKACPFSETNKKLISYYLPTSMYLSREDPSITNQFMPCLNQFIINYPSDPEVIGPYESIVLGLRDRPTKMRYALDLIERNVVDQKFQQNLFQDAFESQTDAGYQILKRILKNPNLAFDDLDQISMLIHNRHAGKTNDNDKALLKIIDSHSLVTQEIKTRDQQTLSGAWGPVNPSDTHWDNLINSK